MKKLLYFLVGLILCPVAVVMARVFMALIRVNQPADGSIAAFSAPFLAFTGGMAAWLLISLTASGSTRAYVLAHELTHALWGLMTGARVSGLRVKKDSGSVTLSKTNALSVLAPYFFPLYAVLIIAVYGAASLFVPVERAQTAWLAAVGFTWGFHLTCTVSALSQEQSDVRLYGHLFSYAMILTMNLLGMSLWVVFTTPVTFAESARLIQQEAYLTGTWLWYAGAWLVQFVSEMRQ